MTKTKRQLRAEAVERLRGTPCAWSCDYLSAMLGREVDASMDRYELRDALINLLTDDEPPDGDAVALMRDLRGCVDVPMLKDALCRETGTHDLVSALETLADMVERDYVSRQDFEAQHRTLCAVREQRDRESEANRSYARVIAKLESERDELKEQLETMRDVTREFRDEREEWKARAEAAQDVNERQDLEYIGQCERIAELESELAKRDKGIKRLKKRRDELKHQLADLDARYTMLCGAFDALRSIYKAVKR